MGVVGMIYEARPNVTVDAAGLALKSGNAVVLRGGSAAGASNRALVDVLRGTLEAHGLPADAVTLLDEGGRDAVRALMTARGLVDVLIPRGGADLIRTVVEESTVPVIETGVGNCHVYVDAAADLDDGAADRGQLQDAPGQRVQLGRDAARAPQTSPTTFLPKVLTALARGRRHRPRRRRAPSPGRGGRRGLLRGRRRRLGRRVPLARHQRARGRLPRRGARARPALRQRPHRGHRHPGPGRRPAVGPPRSTRPR